MHLHYEEAFLVSFPDPHISLFHSRVLFYYYFLLLLFIRSLASRFVHVPSRDLLGNRITLLDPGSLSGLASLSAL
jgi:hypothetical protein